MSSAYEKGQQEIIETLENWQKKGRTLQAACKTLGTDSMKELSHLQDMAKREGNSERSQKSIEQNIDYFKGMLSRLD